YQHSFYPPVAPAFAGISAQQPFLSARLPADAPGIAAYDGRQVFARLLAHIKANPNKGTPEYGMLALGEHECCWAQRFREGLLDAAHQRLFTGPAYSVKSAQFSAALRVYYYTRVRAACPELFTPDDDRQLRVWFAAINQRALTVEWVDWMYALALGQRPAGP